ncbi:radical SAM family heme chaperone HemW [Buchnera aphidicola (Chaitoregma tattakana)]|uniref:radical SAM family heme chaperone HemW n=1 Tax=Buchnera aphidicola TaxID=9 RepID=UPI0031B81364
MKKKINLSLYIHIPWCLRKCPYCNFNVKVFNKKHKNNSIKYMQSIQIDLKNDIKLINKRKICSIFIGGGTPTLLSNKEIEKMLKNIKKKIKFKKDIEITIEIDPSTIKTQNIEFYKKIGINRISLGIQSFSNYQLMFLKRMYKYKKAIKIINYCNKIKEIKTNIDIIHSLPKQSLYYALTDIKIATKSNPDHISWYKLNIEKNTSFYKNKIKNPNKKISLKILKYGNMILKKKGYKQYEISSYHKRSSKSVHNLNYWNFGDYLGIGCGAHGKITQKNGTIIRTIKEKNIEKYISKKYIYKINAIKKKDKIIEFFINKLRLYQPILIKDFLKLTTINPSEIYKNIKSAEKEGYIQITKKKWIPTKKGKNFLEDLLLIFT